MLDRENNYSRTYFKYCKLNIFATRIFVDGKSGYDGKKVVGYYFGLNYHKICLCIHIRECGTGLIPGRGGFIYLWGQCKPSIVNNLGIY